MEGCVPISFCFPAQLVSDDNFLDLIDKDEVSRIPKLEQFLMF